MGPVAVGRIVLAALGAVLLLVGTACGERSEPTGPASQLYPVTVPSSAGGRPLVLDKPARRLAVIAPSVQRILVDMGAGRDIAGVPLTHDGDVVTAQLRRLHPDLIVASSATDDQIVARAAHAVSGVPVYTAPDDSIRGVEETITDLGLITATQGAAVRLVREIEDKRAVVSRRLAKAPRTSVFVATGFFSNLGAFTTASSQSLIGDMLREAHARNVAGDSPQGGPFDARQLARLDPRWILATSGSGTTLEKLRKNRVTKKLGAVRAGRLLMIDAALLAPGPTIGQGLLELARRLHPDAFR
jgi:ABC-type Fe3+-hydroxamate transport system substrate-binding protein